MTACAATYNPPTSGPMATVRFWLSERTPITSLESFESRSCDGRTSLGTLSAPKVAKTPEQSTLVATVRANQEFILKFASFQNGYPVSTTCRATLAFTPREGVAYSVWIDFDTGTGRCLAMLQEIDRDSGRLLLTRDGSSTPARC